MEKEGSLSLETVKELEEDKEVENLKKVEAALFLSARFLTMQDLVMLTDINPLMLRELLDKLIEKYNKEDVAMEIISKENMWKMDVKKEYVGMINKLATGNAEFTKAEQETLAVIAYKQPVKQSIIVKIRGNKAYDHIKHFKEIGLVQAKKSGHTLELRLSDEFFEYFHLQKKEGEEIVMDSMISDEAKERYEEAEREVEEEEKAGTEIEAKQTIESKDETVEEKKTEENVENKEEKFEGNKEALRYPLEKPVRRIEIKDLPEAPRTKEIKKGEEIGYEKSIVEKPGEKIEEKAHEIQIEEEQKAEEKRLKEEIKKLEKKEKEIEKREEGNTVEIANKGSENNEKVEEQRIEEKNEEKVQEIQTEEENAVETQANKGSEENEKIETEGIIVEEKEEGIKENTKEEIKAIEIKDKEKSGVIQED